MMEAVRYSETSALKKATRRHIPENGILKILMVSSGIETATF
jgi:hypothetical protein